MKRLSALILVMILLLAQVCAAGEPAADAGTTPAATTPGAPVSEEPGVPEADAGENAPDHLTVGNTTPLVGNFFTEMWGNITTDQDVRTLLHAYNLIRWDGEEGVFAYDPSVVSGLTVAEDAEGNRSYIFVIQRDLYYSDGTPITANDYAFSILLQVSSLIRELGGTPAAKPQIRGIEDYLDGTTAFLAGVRVITEDTIMITIDNAYLPFFYELALVSCEPYPIHVIAPGVEVRDDGDGVYLANADDTVEEPIFTADLLRETLLDEENGYLSHPSVVSGPYTLTSWDGEKAEFEINPYYKGNYKGEKPSIETLTYVGVDSDTMFDQVKAGEVDVLNKITNAASITEGIALTTDEEQKDPSVAMSNYPRMGMSYVSFACEKETLKDERVRQAIAWCMDRDAILTEYVNYYGLRVDGYYGMGQWLYGLLNGTIAPPVQEPEDPNDAEQQTAYEAELQAYEDLNLDALTVYTLDVNRAADLLADAGWILNEETGIREKEIDGETVALTLTMIYPEGNQIAEAFEQYLVPNLKEAGIQLTLEPKDMSELLTQYYYPEFREADLIFLASNFDVVFDPSSYFTTDQQGGHVWVTTGLADEELYEDTVAMRETEPGDVLTYAQNWVAFQERFNEVLPMVPIYSNIYFDFYSSYLKNYRITESTSWAEAIVGAYLDDTSEAGFDGTDAAAEDAVGADAADAAAMDGDLVEFGD